MEAKVVTFVFFIVLLHGCVTLEAVTDASTNETEEFRGNDNSTAETGELPQAVCDCGSHGKCSSENGRKECHCDWGFAELDGNCEVCNCGSPQNTCVFNRGFKECKCGDGFYEEHGQCEEITMLNWEVREKGSYYIIFRYFPRNGTNVDFGSPEIIETTERNADVQQQPIIKHYTYVGSKEEDVNIILNGPGTYEFRCRVYTKLGNSSYTDWYRWHWNDAANFTGAPEIMRPINNSFIDPGRIIAEWRAPPDDNEVTEYKVVLIKRISIKDKSWRSVGQTYVNHAINRRYYNTTFYDYDTSAYYKLTVTSRGTGFESNVSAPVYFRVRNGSITDDSFITRTWTLLAVTILGSVLGIVLLSLCIYCCVKKRKQSV